jgi:hypothetical protein
VLHALEGFSSLTTASPEKEKHLMSQFSPIVSSPIGVVAALALAAYLEVQGDACFPIILFLVGFYYACRRVAEAIPPPIGSNPKSRTV